VKPLNVDCAVDEPTAAKPAAASPSASVEICEYDAEKSALEPELPPESVALEPTNVLTLVESVAVASEPLIETKRLAETSFDFACAVFPLGVAFEPSGFALNRDESRMPPEVLVTVPPLMKV